MAVLEALPDSATIIACRKRVDFYYWKGIPVARSWPRKSTQPRTAGEVAQSARFAAAVRWNADVSDGVRTLYQSFMPGAVGVTWIDFLRSVALGGTGWFRGP